MKKTIITAVFLVILAIGAFGVIAAPKVNAQSQDIKILSYSTYFAPADSYTSNRGDLVVVGEIQNTGSQIIDLPYLYAVAYTNNGTAVAQVDNTAFVKSMFPGTTAPFYMDFTYASSYPDTEYTNNLNWVPLFDHVIVGVGYAAPANDTQYRGLTIQGKTSYLSSDAFTVTGIIQNSGAQTIGKVWAVTTFYNSTGGVIAANYTVFLTQSLAPNATIPFTATPMDNTAALSNSIASYSVLIQSSPLEATATPTSTASPGVSPTVAPSGSTQPSPSQTSGPTDGSMNSTLTYAAVGAVVVVVVILAMVLIKKRQK